MKFSKLLRKYRLGCFADAKIVCYIGGNKGFQDIRTDHAEQAIPIAVDVIEHDGLVVSAKDLKGKDLEKLIKCAKTAGRNDKGICLILHDGFALRHRFSGG